MALTQPRRSEGRRSEHLTPGSYLTDGKRLLRVVSKFEHGSSSMFASLEDCLTLEVRPYSPGELSVMALRPVSTPGSENASV
jgi:hypothetical protein